VEYKNDIFPVAANCEATDASVLPLSK